MSVLALVAASACTVFGSDQTGQPDQPLVPATAICTLRADPDISGSDSDIFASISGSLPGEVWVVGSHYDGARVKPVVRRWNGTTWNSNTMNVEKLHGTHLEDVSVLAPEDVWTVGFRGHGATVAAHWDGSSWTFTPTPPESRDNDLLGVVASASDDVWAVGTVGVDGSDRTLIEHWDGTVWGLVPSPALPVRASGLRDVAAIGSRDAWAVGWTVGVDGIFTTLAERWDGSRWTRVPTPKDANDAVLAGVAITGPKDVWAVGWSWTDQEDTTIALHWDGSRWTSVGLPGTAGSHARLTGIAIVNGRVMVVGQAKDEQGIERPIAFRSHGSTWSELDVPDSTSGGGGLTGVTRVRGKGMMSVGSAAADSGYASLVMGGC